MMSVYKKRFGTPEAFVPTRFAPTPLCDVADGLPDGVSIDAKITRRGVCLTMPIDGDAGVYGFGLQLRGFQQRGKKKTIRANADPLSDSGDSHAPVPFFVTTAGWGLFVDTARYVTFYNGKAKRRDTGAAAVEERREVALTTEALYAAVGAGADTVMTIEIPFAPGVDVYYFTGDSVLNLVSQYNMFSGGGCMPPLWGLGGFYRCCGQFNEEQVLDIARRFRSYDIPCDILGLEPGWQTCAYSCSYLWDRGGRFPHPEQTVSALNDMGYHVNLWEHAFTNPTAPIYDALKPYAGSYEVFHRGLVPDFTLQPAREIFAAHQRSLCDMGITGFKLDECDGSDYTGGWTFPDCEEFPSGMDGEQYHNLFGLLYTQTLLGALGDTRTWSEVRNMGALAASYPFVLYSDLYAHKDFIRGTVNAGFSGLLWAPEVREGKTREDLIRRVQTVVFSVQALVNAWYLDRMPWEEFDCVDEIRRLFRIRMQLIPYLYTAFYDYRETGKPPIRALVCDHQDEREAWDCEDQYLFGDSMIVAPMTEGEHERRVWLPRGTWYDFFTGERYEGGTHTVVTEDIPVFVKEGTLLPLAEPISCVAPDTQFAITLRAYGDCSDSVCRLIEDDGVTVGAPMKVLCVNADTASLDSHRYRITGFEQIGN
ncbi:MAG: glycoside hydrolase [Clostridia bacterium]|nr:glycoside hydrolase [Clostridia bacterium]